MADQIENNDVNNTLLPLTIACIKKEDDFVEHKVDVSETVIANNSGLQDHTKWYKELEAPNISDNIKVELASSERQCNMIDDEVKIERGICANDIKIEFDNGLLYCEHCHAYYEDYCIECGMLVHILNRNTVDNVDNRTKDELPNDVLEIQHLFGQFGILASKVIPKGVKFGPFTGLHKTECAWKIKGGKFVVEEDGSRYLNWMQYINPARNTFEQNLTVLQCEDYLYYLSTRQIQPGEELLVYFGEEYEDSLNRNVEMDFIPTTEHIFKGVFACILCCLGFSKKLYLAEHKKKCRGGADSDSSFEELTQCPFCKIHFVQKEYSEEHFAYCSERNARKCLAATLSCQITAVNRRRALCSQLYKCEQCKYRTKYKADLKKHTNSQHFKVKKYKCGICYGRFKTRKILRSHVEKTHIFVGGKEDPAHSRCDYVNAHISKVEQLRSQCQRKGFKSLTRHMKPRHLRNVNFKCDSFAYKTNRRRYLEYNIKTKQLKEFNFKCDSCEYGTNRKCNLVNHIRTRHLKEFHFKCDACDYGTNQKCNLVSHIRTRHLKEFNFKCDSCEYGTNRKRNLDEHKKTIHLKEFQFKCDSCEYGTNQKCKLVNHIRTRHLKECHFKCDACEYGTNQKCNLVNHIRARHLKEFNFKCDSCEYGTNHKRSLDEHIKTKHLKEFHFKCNCCEYETNRKYDLGPVS